MLGSAGAPNISNSALMQNSLATGGLTNLNQPQIIAQNTSGNMLAKIKNLPDK